MLLLATACWAILIQDVKDSVGFEVAGKLSPGPASSRYAVEVIEDKVAERLRLMMPTLEMTSKGSERVCFSLAVKINLKSARETVNFC